MKSKKSGNFRKLSLDSELPPEKTFVPGIRRAPDRGFSLNEKETILALKNALRYLPENLHEALIPEFLEELRTRGRIYGYRFRPEGRIYGKPVDKYGGILEARALQVNIDNNLDFDVALYPYELVTYGETGQVCQNWMQYCLIKKYLEVMQEDQTLVISSGHPLGLFPSKRNAPRVISTNGLLVGEWDNQEEFKKLSQMGVSNYGQMTAGGWMYIGPQGIVHGTYITLLNAGRKYLGIPDSEDLKGRLYLSSGLGGMSGAQAKAIEIAGGVGIIAEVDQSRIKTRLDQGWVSRVSSDLEEVSSWAEECKAKGIPQSIAYLGNVVDLLEYMDDHGTSPELLSDQTSCHAVYDGGYTPQGISFDEGRRLLHQDPSKFKEMVDRSLLRHYSVLRSLTSKGGHFWDYGNSFMASVFSSGIKEIASNGEDTNDGFIWPSYVEDIMGPVCFDLGFGPFRWICLSGNPKDLETTDRAARDLIDPKNSALERDNYQWIREAGKNNLVVGTKARILYADEKGRVNIALKFNRLVRSGKIGPVIIGRDHHDVSGTDSPYRETSNIYDGSRFTADMATQSFAGNAARGMTLVVLSNGGGVGIGRAINGGNGLVLDGSRRVEKIIKSSLSWDVMGGVARRSWAQNEGALKTAKAWNERNRSKGRITIPFESDTDMISRIVKNNH